MASSCDSSFVMLGSRHPGERCVFSIDDEFSRGRKVEDFGRLLDPDLKL